MDPYQHNGGREEQGQLEELLQVATPKARVKLQLTEQSLSVDPCSYKVKKQTHLPCSSRRRISSHAGRAILYSASSYLPDARQNSALLANRQLCSPWWFCSSVANY